MSEKLQKTLANLGYGSRRVVEQWIAEGRLVINDRKARLGDRVEPQDQIRLDGKLIHRRKASADAHRVILYNKPAGEICTRSDPEGRPSVFARLPRLRGGRWVAVGRLDINTSGLLLFTTDGELANRLMHPASGVEREYVVRVKGTVDDEVLAHLRAGVELEDGMARFTDIQPGGGEGANRWYYVVIMEGRNREVRRLWESQHVQVSRLKRVRYGNIFIPSRVRAGRWADLTSDEIAGLYALAGLRAPRPAGARPPKRKRP